ncbi:Lrp/AsnC ligand binding domain-containing protein [Rhodococcus spongiicola]|uniref:Lrp/AsnC family transcriptional regulator n=1 Tax=Rhodococcus spongiicola TaxID=2487352 RepID=A0A438B1A0_9NOCA|nr:Lrp/AsnC ligand binding domain-containing protein [Rhodococcus spongiicola]RVW04733.1 Lrp/AsnC family transcriptional regulator [Rhodococcus spongiicola]
MVQAFVLIQTEVGRAATVAATLARISGVDSAEDVLGPYDVIARVGAPAESGLSDVVDDMKKVQGITRILTCQIAAPAAPTEN